MLVLAAAEAAEAGKSVSEILDLVEDMIPRVETSFVLDRLDYMKKGGRCSAVTALGANLLKLHPCVEVIGGKMSVTKKYRGSWRKWWGTMSGSGSLAGRTSIPAGFFWWTPAARRACGSGEGGPGGGRPFPGDHREQGRPAPFSATAVRIPWVSSFCASKETWKKDRRTAVFFSWGVYLTAMASTSHKTPLGSSFTATQLRRAWR